MKKFLSKVLLTVLCVVSSLALFASCDEEVENPVSEYDFSFTGEITLNEIYYEVVMEGKDNAFTVDAGNLSSVTKGSYTFTEGKGYTFTFNDSASTIVRTQYDASSQTFSFIYTLDLGTARGQGICFCPIQTPLSCTKESFGRTFLLFRERRHGLAAF